MSDVTQDSMSEAIPPAMPESGSPAWLDWVKSKWARVRLGHEGVMLGRIQRVQRCGEVLARNSMSGETGDTSGWPTEVEGDEMGVNIGDNVVNNYYSQPKGPPALPQQRQPSLIRKALPYVLSAALGGGAAGALLPWLLSKTPEHPPAVTDTDTTRRIEIDKWIPGAED